jgi:hypothetical protein
MAGMKVDEAVTVSSLMNTINNAGDGADGDRAYFALAEVKQDLIDHEDYEVLKDLHFLEQAHNITIPFKMRT